MDSESRRGGWVRGKGVVRGLREKWWLGKGGRERGFRERRGREAQRVKGCGVGEGRG